MKVLITGANGFVGLNVVKALVAAQHQVTAYVRASSNVSFLVPFGVTLVRGELHDSAALRAAMAGQDAVIHTAGNTSSNPRDWPLLEAVNIEGTRRVTDAARETGIARLVFTSTTSTIGARNNPQVESTEETPLRGFRVNNPYAKSKLQAEECVYRACDRGLSAVILNPAEVLGAYDYSMQWGRMVLAVTYNQLPFMPPGGASFCGAAAVAEAHVSALTQGTAGERYIIAGVNVRYTELIKTIEAVTQCQVSLPQTPYSYFYLKTWLQEKFPRLIPGEPVLDAYRLRVFKGSYYFSSAKAERELGYQPASLSQMVEECATWYRANGFIASAPSESLAVTE
ncbi:NAD-dependent epimerase/dehydratase family protein [Rouxiella badensis]|jgi:dihydroflavonol-4-reductase|uniref:NAD-dependent epimerase/dehydratase family protein n=1 Tax=Rouxiella badensis TaxID=1646377 RepID=UPI001788181C|nr:NAD-dependent epimerase/dehydratase family protein [Rouxiella badensis]MCC3703533.1 NAD-dependent epimerase/dehydratase family protein [Rouxiella badensis]MCC3719282.1 NAD-dependent epimerase/dehydratase family protein [Rouxiella badensis]MCC3728532.1 NAD-dependent epimerase/dehydratase family protein [Rouxiella badensis]MCC3734382.1 NAD-dependent epimerase/dehydratase family protein [Rouxiella badensis]MCC3739472.1 NAD-dependent epimerase/dehydratase family protein [Rouxiella badensis]